MGRRNRNSEMITTQVQVLLQKVYLTMCCGMAVSALGIYLQNLWNMRNLTSSIGFITSTVWLKEAPPQTDERVRVFVLMAAALFYAACFGPLLQSIFKIDLRIIISEFVGTALAFGSFRAAAMSRRKMYLYIGGLLFSCLSISIWLHFASTIFGGSTADLVIELHIGLLMLVVWIISDTRGIINRRHHNDFDYVKYALNFQILLLSVAVLLCFNTTKANNKTMVRSPYVPT